MYTSTPSQMLGRALLALPLLLTTSASQAAEWRIETVAGNGSPQLGPHAGLGTQVAIGDPFGVEFGPDGRLYITEVRNHRIWALDTATGQAVVVAGNGTRGYSGDGGPATEAQLNEPYEVRFDGAGQMYFVEMQNHLVRRVELATGIIHTLAGTGQAGLAGDGGPATQARFAQPHSIALDGDGGLYIADIGNHRIRRVDLQTGIVTTIAGNGDKKLPVAGQLAAGHPLFGPRALWIERGTIWIALREGHSVWTLPLASGRLAHLAGTGRRGFDSEAVAAAECLFNGPKGIALDRDGNVYLADTENQVLRRIETRTGRIETIAGRGPEHAGYGGDGGPAVQALLNRPHGICVGPDGAVYTGDTLNHRVRRVRFE